jgi:photosystem II stability/assembly factor-like uncharacterized protein
MKRFILFLSLLPAVVAAQWNLIYNHADVENAMAALNKDTVVCVTDMGGRVHRTTNGGQSWNFYQTQFTTSWFYDVHFPTQLVGYACGGTAFGQYMNVIIKTTNAGQTWDSVTCNDYTGYSFNKIHFVHPDTGFVSGEFNGLLKTVNGGGTFTPVSFPDGGVGSAIHFIGSQTGLVGTSKYLSSGKYVYSILRTQNQGSSWTKVYTDTMTGVTGLNHRLIRDIHFVNPSIAYAVGGNGLFLTTQNGGLSWSTFTLSPGTDLQVVRFINPNRLYTNLAGGIQQSLNSGTTWTAQNISPLGVMMRLEFANDSIGYAICNSDVYKTNQPGLASAIKEAANYSQAHSLFYPNPVHDHFYREGDQSSIREISIYSASGQLVKQFDNGFAQMDLSELCPGLYLIRLQKGSALQFGKLVKE